MGTFRFFAVIFALVALISFTLGWSTAQAQPGQGGPRMMCQDRFASMDANKDGQVDGEEFMSFNHPGGNAEQMFTLKDTNADGLLTGDEFCAGRGMGGRKGK